MEFCPKTLGLIPLYHRDLISELEETSEFNSFKLILLVEKLRHREVSVLAQNFRTAEPSTDPAH